MVYVSIDGRVAGAVAMEDEVRPDAAGTVEGLRKLGLRTAMISGDKQAAAEAVAAKVGIDPQQVGLLLPNNRIWRESSVD